jgi:hypothetical protein
MEVDTMQKRKPLEHIIEGNTVKVFKGERVILMERDVFELIEEKQYTVAINSKGYVLIRKMSAGVYVFSEYLHRMTIDSKETVDHIDRNPLNNLRSNLRPASRAEQNLNKGTRADNSTGVKGVWYHKKNKKYVGEVWYKKKKYNCGSFETLEEAEKAVKTKRAELHGEAL